MEIVDGSVFMHLYEKGCFEYTGSKVAGQMKHVD
jgi:hypothetical protein